MNSKFAVFNPMTGLYTYTETETERDKLLCEIAWEFFLWQTHNAPYANVQVNEDGSEVWTGLDGKPRLNIQQMEELQLQIEASILKSQTAVETLP